MTKMSLAVICASLCALLLAVPAAAVELAKYPMVFSGPQGLHVALAPTADGSGALMRISGINHPIDGVVFLGRLSHTRTTDSYVTMLDGRDYSLVQKRNVSWNGEDVYVVYLPGRRDEVVLRYDEEKSGALKPTAMLASYRKQKAAGVQLRLARFDRDKHLVLAKAALQRADLAATNACGSTVTTRLDWSRIDDDKLMRLSIPGYCGEVASQIEQMCEASDSFKSLVKLKGLGHVSCRFGDALRLRQVSGGLEFVTRESAPNQGDFIRQYLRNQ